MFDYIGITHGIQANVLQLTPQLLKSSVTTALINLLAPIQAEFQASQAWQEVEQKAYPSAQPEKKKKKEKKDKGSKYPGAAARVTAQPDGSVEGPGKEKVDVGGEFAGSIEKLEVKDN
jgi:tyrosyl-tRNA synthetase